MSAKHTPGPWEPVNQSVGAGYALKRPWTVQKPGQWYATNGRVHRYASEGRAQQVADTLNLGESIKQSRAKAEAA